MQFDEKEGHIMINLTISCENIEDAMTLEQWNLVDAHVEWAEKAISSGGRVVFERRYCIKEPDVVLVIASAKDLADWKIRVASAIEALKSIKKGA